MKSWQILLLAVAGLSAACSEQARTDRSTKVGTSSQAVGPAASRVLVPWGKGPSALGLTAAAKDRLAYGPQSLTVDPQGRVLVLDAQNKRVARLVGTELTTLAHVPVDADEIVAGPDGAFAVRRQLNRAVSVFDATGAPAGEVTVPAELGDAMHITMGISHRVGVETAHQESFVVGSPAAPLAVPSMWSGKREGTGALSGGRGVQVVKNDSGLALHVMAFEAEGEKWRSVATHKLAGDAGHVAGAKGDVACVKVEKVHADMQVEREAICLRASTGEIVLRAAMAAPGLYVPRRELVFANGRLLHTRPTEDGLEITSWEVVR